MNLTCEAIKIISPNAGALDNNIVLVAGGTGGHVFPAIAVAEALIKYGNYNVTIITDNRGNKVFTNYNCSHLNAKVRILPLEQIKYKLSALLENIINIGRSFIVAWGWLNEINPKVVVGFGGYSVFPVLLACVLQRRAYMVHEQNAVLGVVNRYFALLAKKVMYSFANTRGLQPYYQSKTVLTGMPVREEICQHQPTEVSTQFSSPSSSSLGIAVIGGSQGARVFTKILPQVINKLSPEQRKSLRIIQQCHSDEIEELKKRYQSLGIEAEVKDFFSDIVRAISQADLLITRAGASTIAELIVMNKAALLVPYPQAKDNHQRYNAEVVTGAGGGWYFDQDRQFTPENVSHLISSLLSSQEEIMKKKQALFKLIPAEPAAKKVASIVIEFIYSRV